MSKYYSLFGLNIRSEVELDAPPLNVGTADIDVDIECGQVPDYLDEGRRYNPLNWVAPGKLLLTLPSVARYLVTDGRDITVDADPTADRNTLTLFTSVSPLAGVLHQRKQICLHASAVAMKNGTALFMAPSGVGKSTLAAALARRGHEVITDDIAVLEKQSDQSWSVLPGPSRIKLWPDSLDALGMDASQLSLVRTGIEKRMLRVNPTHVQPRRLAALCVLGLQKNDGISVTRLPLHRTMEALMFNTFRRRMQAAVDAEHENFKRLAAVAGAVPCFSIERATDSFDLVSMINEVEQLMASLT